MKIEWVKFKDKLGPQMQEGWRHGGPEMRDEYLRSYNAWQGVSMPKERKLVMVQIAPKEEEGLPAAVAIGYLRYAAGDPECPYFVIPGIGGQVTAYADCLPDDFAPECWHFPEFTSRKMDTNLPK